MGQVYNRWSTAYDNDNVLPYDQEANKLNSTIVANSGVHRLFDEKIIKSQCSKNNLRTIKNK